MQKMLHHPQFQKRPYVQPPPHQFRCTSCNRSFYFPSELQLHKTSHRKTKYYQCLRLNCHKSYKWKQDLLCHDKCHEAGQFNCNDCDFLATEKCLLRRHELTHSSKKTYHCSLCKKPYKHYNSLNRHIKKCRYTQT